MIRLFADEKAERRFFVSLGRTGSTAGKDGEYGKYGQKRKGSDLQAAAGRRGKGIRRLAESGLFALLNAAASAFGLFRVFG